MGGVSEPRGWAWQAPCHPPAAAAVSLSVLCVGYSFAAFIFRLWSQVCDGDQGM